MWPFNKLKLFKPKAEKKEKIRIRLNSKGNAAYILIPEGYDDPASKQMIEGIKLKYIPGYGLGGLGGVICGDIL